MRAGELGPHLLRVRGIGTDRDRERPVAAQGLAHDLGVAVQPAHARAVGGVDDEGEGHSPRPEPPPDLADEAIEPPPPPRPNPDRAAPGGLAFGAVVEALARRAIEQVDLVPDLDQPGFVLRRDPELT